MQHRFKGYNQSGQSGPVEAVRRSVGRQSLEERANHERRDPHCRLFAVMMENRWQVAEAGQAAGGNANSYHRRDESAALKASRNGKLSSSLCYDVSRLRRPISQQMGTVYFRLLFDTQ